MNCSCNVRITSYNVCYTKLLRFAGRSTDAKRALYKGIAANLAGAGFDPLRVFIIVHDLPRENWGLRGGVAGCDLDFGFKIDV